MQADAAAAGLMVSNCASRLVSAGWQCIWLSSDVPVLAKPVLPRLSVSLETDNSLPPPRSARLTEVTIDVALCRSHRSSIRRLDQSLTSAGRRPDVRTWMTTRCRCTWRPLDVGATSLCLLGYWHTSDICTKALCIRSNVLCKLFSIFFLARINSLAFLFCDFTTGWSLSLYLENRRLFFCTAVSAFLLSHIAFFFEWIMYLLELVNEIPKGLPTVLSVTM